jgi:hypothetical protein
MRTLVTGLVLVGLAASASSASATLVGEVAESVGSTVESVEATPQAAPLPGAPPAPPQAPVPAQTEAAPSPSPSPGNVPSADGAAGAAKEAAGSVESAGAEATRQTDASLGTEGSRATTYPSGSAPAPNKASTPAIGTAFGAPPSVVAAEVAPLHRWLARIWPAIALGGGDRGWVAGVMEDLLRPAAAVTARLLPLYPSVSVAPAAVADSRLARQHGTANAPQPPLLDAAASGDAGRVAYLIAFAALMAILAFTIWKEFRASLRPRH